MSITTKEAIQMTTTTVAAPAGPASRAPFFRRVPLMLRLAAIMLAAIAIGTWLGIARATGGGDAWPANFPVFRTWLLPVNVVGLERQLVRTGYSIRVDGVLDPVTKSALADFLRPGSLHPLGASLAAALQDTVITARRDPTAWNMRFGLNRRTSFVERPLTGPGGQLDANGNLRPHR
jgi:hypothetical protein